jgi:hypothetical protein
MVQLLQAFSEEDVVRRVAFSDSFVLQLKERETLDTYIVFSDKASFYLNESKRTVSFCGIGNLHSRLEIQRDSPKVKFSVHFPKTKLYGSFLLVGKTN